MPAQGQEKQAGQEAPKAGEKGRRGGGETGDSGAPTAERIRKKGTLCRRDRQDRRHPMQERRAGEQWERQATARHPMQGGKKRGTLCRGDRQNMRHSVQERRAGEQKDRRYRGDPCRKEMQNRGHPCRKDSHTQTSNRHWCLRPLSQAGTHRSNTCKHEQHFLGTLGEGAQAAGAQKECYGRSRKHSNKCPSCMTVPEALEQ
eukprot:1160679-Pelagomonas_calceolata.AAC.19